MFIILGDTLISYGVVYCQYCYAARYHMEFGVGFLYFWMVNMRGVYKVGFFRGGMTAVAHSYWYIDL